ncbi:MAG TPA: OB-fold domain-containing protein [Acidimicrobiales bacterium]|jgi:hypothetical protein|nr:OB-fold domain-containing protein [Acidimicrobiales bacterium]
MTADSLMVEACAARSLPRLTDDNRSFWTSGSSGRLHVPRCQSCRRYVLPASLTCSTCGGSTTPEPVSGRAAVFTWTVNEHQFHPDIPPPTIIAIVVLDEQDDLRLATNLVDCRPADVRIGLPVSVRFEDHGEIFYPVFAP